MQLTLRQEQGLTIALERFKRKEKYTVISGYAGTGKSTLVKFIVSALCNNGINEDEVCFCAFTGKATQVLAKKGNKHTMTLHKLLYDFKPRADGSFFKIQKPQIEYKVVIVDEVSMAPKELMDLLFHHDVYVICCGDPFQLPPIDKDTDNKLLEHPHIFLDEIMRQAQESEIIRLSMELREMKTPQFQVGEEIQVLDKTKVGDTLFGMYEWADQILVATNKTRDTINQQMRELGGRSGPPQDGDKIICARNYWDDLSTLQNPLVNGTIGYLQNSFTSYIALPYWVSEPHKIDVLYGQLVSDDDVYSIDMDMNMIVTGKPSLDKKTAFKVSKKVKLPKECLYGYAITVHRAQGSEWDKVVIVEENFPFAKEEHARWLYTGLTRSAKKAVLLR